MALFGPKPWANRFGKMSIFQLFELLVFIAQKSVFSLQNIVKDIFFPYIGSKKKVQKMAISGPKVRVNLFGKTSIFRLLNFLILQLRKAFLRSRISSKTFSWPILPKKKILEKWPFLDQNNALTPLKKCQFFNCLNFLFLQLRKMLFRSRISSKTFSWPILPKKKCWKNGHFWTITMSYPLWKNFTFSTF